MTQDTNIDHLQAGLATPSEQQFAISYGEQHATVVEVGGGLHSYDVGGRDLLDGYSREEPCTGARGLPLIPWPNRIQDGAYTFDGTDYQVPLTEPRGAQRHPRLPSLAKLDLPPAHRRRIVMGTVLHPPMGYPFTLDVRVDYQLTDAGLTVGTTATNIGSQPCPYGTGQHPYLTLGTELIDTCHLQLDAARWLPIDERGLPTEEADVVGSAYDFRSPRPPPGTACGQHHHQTQQAQRRPHSSTPRRLGAPTTRHRPGRCGVGDILDCH